MAALARHQHRAGETITFFLDDVDGLEVDYPNLSKFVRAAQEFSVYIASMASGSAPANGYRGLANDNSAETAQAEAA